jgi:membrane-associated phospholipid phosphatase
LVKSPYSKTMRTSTGWQAAEDAVMALAPREARRGSTWFGRLGDIAQQPPIWAGIAAALGLFAGEKGRRAAFRGSALYGVSAVVANLVIKPLVGRSRPPGAGEGRVGPVTSSFPSGHAATDLAFSFGVAQELPWLFIPLAGATAAAHWSLVRSRGHYPTDVFAGGVLAVALALAAWRLWPPGPPENRS